MSHIFQSSWLVAVFIGCIALFLCLMFSFLNCSKLILLVQVIHEVHLYHNASCLAGKGKPFSITLLTVVSGTGVLLHVCGFIFLRMMFIYCFIQL